MIVELSAEAREAEARAAAARGHFLLAARIRRGDDLKPRMLADSPEAREALAQKQEREAQERAAQDRGG